MPSVPNQSIASEVDIIRMVCDGSKMRFKSSLVDNDYESANNLSKSHEAVFRQSKIIWSGYTKMIRS
jgi:hypothetical protein